MALFGLFKPKCPLPLHEWEWVLACIKWLDEEFPQPDMSTGAAALVTPTPENFPEIPKDMQQRATRLFARTKELAGLNDWPTELIGYNNISNAQLISPNFLGAYKWSDAAGTFQLIKDTHNSWIARISYDYAQLNDPESFIATMAHELSHYLMSTAKRCPPGGWDLHELATDVMAVWLGFGIFLANNAKSFEGISNHDTQGWQVRTSGYLNERAILTVMALCLSLRGETTEEVTRHLKPYLVKGFKVAVQYIENNNVSKMLADIDLDEFGVEIVDVG
jgi:hypothetical protein